jgi:molecular chaperone Hsp33
MSEIHRFIFEGLPVRGQLVRLTASWRELLRRRVDSEHSLPGPVRDLLGEMTVAATLMQANIRFNGALILQIFGDGPVKLAVAEVQNDLAFRSTAKVVGEIKHDADFAQLLNHRGEGRCALTLDPVDKSQGQQPYQGVVALRGLDDRPLGSLGEVLEHYMRQSEQLETRLVLAADGDVAAGLLIQRLPVEGVGNLGVRVGTADPSGDEAFNRVAHLTATLTRTELLTLDAQTLLRRLYWEEPLRQLDSRQQRSAAPRFECRCSRGRVGRMLQGLGRVEVDDILAERGDVEIGCEFCGLQYRFDAVDVGELFTPPQDQIPPSAAIN